ncbi:hypothetical protein KY342_01645, partial [Candidatus Woesearchaeota archaeon]|nr:hypothetical protein [Candidatus Woesearchaeota archaeon]
MDDYRNPEEIKSQNSEFQTPEQSSNEARPELVEVEKPAEPERQPEPVVESASMSNNTVDAELEEMLSKQSAKIKVVGAGGGGNNTINRITEV